MSTGIRRSAPSRRRLLGTALVLGAALGVAACGGGRVDPPGPDTGVTRQFDEYPASLSIEGPGIVESGATLTLQARADNNEYRGPAYLTSSAAQTLRVAGSPAGLTTPASVLLLEDRADRNFLSGEFVVAAPSVTAATPFSVSVDNPRASAQRVVTVVPAGALYIRRLLLSRPVIEAGQSVTIEIELSQPAPVATEVQLAANRSRLELPASVTVPANERSVTVTVLAQESPGQDYVTVSATLDGLAQQASLWVRSAQAFVLKIELDRHYQAPHPDSVPAFATRRYNIPVRLSKPVGPGGLTITLTSNNTFATVPASVVASPGLELIHVPFEIAAFVDSTGARFSGLSAVRITASGGGTTRIGDALLGRDEGTPVIESLALHRLTGGPSGGLIEAAPCFNSNNHAHGIPILGRANIVLDRAAPAGGFRINLFAHSSVFRLQQEFSIPAGTSAISFDFEIPTGTAGEQLRFVKVTARSVDTLQERSDTLLVGEGGGGVAADLTSGSGSLGKARNHIPYFDWDPQPTAGGVLRGRVTLGEVDANGNFVEAHAHGVDDVPVYLRLRESGALVPPLPTATLTIPALLGYADFELPLPAGAARQVVLRADAYSMERRLTGPLCDLSYERPIDLGAGGTLAFAVVTPRHVFRGEGGTVTVTLSEPAPATGAVVELTANAGPSFITLPAQVVVPAGATNASVSFGTSRLAGFVTVDVQAHYGNSTNARVELMPEPEPLGLRFDPTTLHYGSNASLRLELPARYPVPMVATLSAVDFESLSVLSFPTTVVVPAGQLGVSAPVQILLRNAGGQTTVAMRASVRLATADARADIASIYTWSDIGAPISVAGVAQAPSMGGYFQPSSETQALMLASIDTEAGAQGRLFVRRFSSLTGDWSGVGPGALNPTSLTSASQPSLLNDGFGTPGSRPLLAFTQGNGVQQNVFVVRFDPVADEWLDVSATQSRLNTIPSSSRAVQPVLTTVYSHAATAPIGLAFIEDGAVQFAWFDGIVWRYASPPPSMTGNARDVRFLRGFRFLEPGIVRLVWLDDGDPTVPIKAAQLDLAGGPWTALPAPAVPPATPGTQRLEFFSADSPDNSVVWSQSTLPAQVMRARYDASSNAWATTSVDAPADPAARLTALALNRGGFGDVMFATDSGPGRRMVWLRRFDGVGWVNAAPPDAVTQRVVDLSFTAGASLKDVRVASVRQSEDGTQYTLQVRGIYAP